jgi:hypothetical protein
MTPSDPLTQTSMRELLKESVRRPQNHRRFEDYGLVAGIAVVSIYALTESALKLGVARPATCASGFPYVTVMLALLLILPKMIGRRSAGEVWKTLATKFTGGAS